MGCVLVWREDTMQGRLTGGALVMLASNKPY